mmetsp:Transcript_131400/g.380131  ORF Transcript_131400/g.380131 Transcript_131400/m.380131 type:complete len:121 (+) Transcript_131400:873-1235(+)
MEPGKHIRRFAFHHQKHIEVNHTQRKCKVVTVAGKRKANGGEQSPFISNCVDTNDVTKPQAARRTWTGRSRRITKMPPMTPQAVKMARICFPNGSMLTASSGAVIVQQEPRLRNQRCPRR